MPEQYEESKGLNLISCPSCSRVENSKFTDLAMQIREATQFAQDRKSTIATMGCRVNGPGETDHADFGFWCGPNFVNVKRFDKLVGRFSYEEVVPWLVNELQKNL